MASKISISLLRVFNMALGPPDHIPIKRFRLGEMQSYEVLVNDFNRIEDEAMTIGSYFAFAVACIPTAITLNVTLATVKIDDLNVKAPIMCLMFVCYILGAFFARGAYQQRGRLKKFMQTIRDAQTPPLGEKGSELGPSEVNLLPSGPTGPVGPESGTPGGAQ
jgi:hypothetical protein